MKNVNNKVKFLKEFKKEGETTKKFNERIDKIFYSAAVKYLRKNQLTQYKFDLRSLSSGKKSLITRSINNIKENNINNFIQIHKLKGETDKKFHKRVNKIKKKWGQSSNSTKGIFLKIPQHVKSKAKIDKEGKLIFKKFIPNLNEPFEATKEVWIPLNPKLFMINPKNYILNLINTYKPTIIIPIMGKGNGQGREVLSNPEDEIDMIIEDFKNIVNAYEIENIISQNFLTGFIMRYHFIKNKKVKYV